MSAYVTKAEVERAAGGSQRLIELTDVENSGLLNEERVDDVIEEASGWVDSFARIRFSVPFASPSTYLRRLVAAEAVYLLKRDRRGMVSDDERIQHEERLGWLRDLAAGKATPGEDPSPTKASDVQPGPVQVDDDQLANTRANYRGFV